MVKACVTSFDTTPFLCKKKRSVFAVSDLRSFRQGAMDRKQSSKVGSDELWGYSLLI